jgi:hypothetical protein
MSTGWNDDDVLLSELEAALAEAAGVPPGIAHAGRDLFTWRTIDAELSELAYDSATDADSALVRSASAARRSLTFRSSRLTIELDLEYGPDAIRGQLVPTGALTEQPAEVVVDVIGRSSSAVPVDAVGYFSLEPFALTDVRFRLRCGGVRTPWIT